MSQIIFSDVLQSEIFLDSVFVFLIMKLTPPNNHVT